MKILQRWPLMAILVTILSLASTVACTGRANVGSFFSSESDDTIAPTLTTRGPMMIMEGEPHDSTFLTKGIKYSDNSGLVRLTIDSSAVDWNRRGIYNVVYAATDSAHNVTTVTEQLRVVGKDEKIIYLTFDDGPSVCTDDILRILKEENVKATFFVTAQFTPYLSKLTDISRDGHEVAIHTYSHNFKMYQSIENYFDDLNKIKEVIIKYTGKSPRIMRHPGGSSNTIFKKYNRDPQFMDRLCVALLDSGYQFVDWNLDSRDASGNNVPVNVLVRSACQTSHHIQCLLMHDTGAKRTTVQALPQIIRFFKQQGYEFGVINSVDYVCWHGGLQKLERLNRLRAQKPAVTPLKETSRPKPVKIDTTTPAPAQQPVPKPKVADSTANTKAKKPHTTTHSATPDSVM
ncbi:MAG: polysaccharide deacetylase family protein [Muribaculaceae bacterium]